MKGLERMRLKFIFEKWAAEALRKIDLSDVSPLPEIEGTKYNTLLFVEDTSLEDLKLSMTTEISLKGLNNQNTVNELGKKLYKIYDEILYQQDYVIAQAMKQENKKN